MDVQAKGAAPRHAARYARARGSSDFIVHSCLRARTRPDIYMHAQGERHGRTSVAVEREREKACKTTISMYNSSLMLRTPNKAPPLRNVHSVNFSSLLFSLVIVSPTNHFFFLCSYYMYLHIGRAAGHNVNLNLTHLKQKENWFHEHHLRKISKISNFLTLNVICFMKWRRVKNIRKARRKQKITRTRKRKKNMQLIVFNIFRHCDHQCGV